MLSTLKDWLDYISSLHDVKIQLSLSVVQEIAIEQGFVQFNCPVITVAGTNGKGSCVRILENVYLKAGYRVGSYYSPHLLRFNERIRIDGEDIDDLTLIKSFSAVDSMRKGRSLTFFEFTTLSAVHIFHTVMPDIVILEVGLGGREDAVNVIEPDVALITSIGLDHMDYLGDNREVIGYEKAGIYRTAKPAICGEFYPPQSVVRHAEKIRAQFLRVNKDFSYTVRPSKMWDWLGPYNCYHCLPRPLLKCQNAATSLMAVECLQDRLPVTKDVLAHAMIYTQLPGRFQSFSKPVKGVLDVAHNPDSVQYLAKQIARNRFPNRIIAVIAMLRDKDIPGTIEPLLSHVDCWYVAGLKVERAAPHDQIVSCLRVFGVKKWYNFDTVVEAVNQAIASCSHPEDRIIIFGSFYTVAAAQRCIGVG